MEIHTRADELEKDYEKLLQRTKEQRKSTTRVLTMGYVVIIFMVSLCIFELSRDNHFWMLVYALLGLLNLRSIPKLHKNLESLVKIEFRTMAILMIIKKQKEHVS